MCSYFEMYSYLNKINENTNSAISVLLQTVIQAYAHTLSDQDGQNEKQALDWGFSCN